MSAIKKGKGNYQFCNWFRACGTYMNYIFRKNFMMKV